MTTVEFTLPAELEASTPALRRDSVRLLVARRSGLQHARFAQLAEFLEPGDLVVVNTSATLPAAVPGRRADGAPVVVHFSTPLDDGTWLVELRPTGVSRGSLPDVRAGEQIVLPDDVVLTVQRADPRHQRRLWRSAIGVEGGVLHYLARHGQPIRYAYVPYTHPLEDYQTVFARDAGSAEMPSAGRPFTTDTVTDLVVRGVGLAPVTLHTGVSSQENGEPPLPERFAVPSATARLVNSTRANGGRIVAVGTTVTRALETVAEQDGTVHADKGWTELVLGPQRPARVVTGLVTGWHAPGASHLQLLQAVAGAELVQNAYIAALRARYHWHEFGDSCLLLP